MIKVLIYAIFNYLGKKLMISAFGSTDFPTKQDPNLVC